MLVDASKGAGMRAFVAVVEPGVEFIVGFDVGERVSETACGDVSREDAMIPRFEPGSPR